MTEFLLKVCSHVRKVGVDPSRHRTNNMPSDPSKNKENESDEEISNPVIKSLVFFVAIKYYIYAKLKYEN